MSTLPPPAKGWARRFFTIWTGQAFSLFGSSLVQFALVWWLTAKTGSATVLAIGTLIAMIPQVLVGPLAGTLVDRWNRRVVMIVADTFVAAATTVLLLLFFYDQAQIWHIYLIMLVRSVAGAFHYPAMASSTSLMVPQKHLSRVGGLNEALRGLMNIAAPPVGALAVLVMPMHWVLAIDLITAVIAVIPLLLLNIPQPERATSIQKTSVMSDFREGLRYLRNWRGMLMVILMAAALNALLTPASAMNPLIVTKHFGRGPGELAGLESIFGIGVVIGGILIGVWGGFKRKMLTSLSGILGIGAGSLMIGLAPASAFWMAIVGNFMIGFFLPIANGPLSAVFQTVIAPEMQGRVMSLLSAIALSASLISLAIAGPLADVIGVTTFFALAGVACIVLGLLASTSSEMLNVENHGKNHPDPTDSGVMMSTSEVSAD